MGVPAVIETVQNIELTGLVRGGQPPVTGANIALFATGDTGYNGTLKPLATAQTDSSGNFKVTTAIVCPTDPTTQAYVVATGGNPGLASGTDNAAIFLVAALGPCSGLASVPSVVINEVTTVAAAYALSGFAPVGGAGMTESAVTGGTALPGITTSSTNTQGLTDGFANAANIVNAVTGEANATTVGGNGVVPVGTIDALADILQSCVNTASPTSAGCMALFKNATPPAGSAIVGPVNVFQGALDIAQFPGNNVAALFGLISAQPAFPATLTVAPNDWTIGVSYTSSLLASPLGMEIDANDNVYVSGSTNADLIKFTAQGAGGTTNLLPTLSSASDNIREMAFDPSGNLWLTDGGKTQDGPLEYTASGALVASNTYATSNQNSYAIAADKYGDLWMTSYKKSTCSGTTGGSACTLFEFVDSQATPATYTDVYQFGTGQFEVKSPTDAGGARGLAVDSKTGNVWLTDIVSGNLTLFQATLASGAAANVTTAAAIIPLGTSATNDVTNNYGSVAVAVDANSNAWAVVMGGPAATGSAPTSAVPAALYGVNSVGAVLSTANGLTDNGNLITPSFLAIDGNNNIFIANTGASVATSAIVEYSPGSNENAGAFLSPNLGYSPGATFSGGALSGGTVYQDSDIAIDRSGAMWVMSTGSGVAPSLANLVQILGVAAPTDPVLADGKFGVKP
jgi:hypothetical protein